MNYKIFFTAVPDDTNESVFEVKLALSNVKYLTYLEVNVETTNPLSIIIDELDKFDYFYFIIGPAYKSVNSSIYYALNINQVSLKIKRIITESIINQFYMDDKDEKQKIEILSTVYDFLSIDHS
ncbi:hypothetical protein U3516DRAFT_740121 [Neocallimastix sp. 'constans']